MEAHGPRWKTSTHPPEARYETTKPITTSYDHGARTQRRDKQTAKRTKKVISTLGTERSHFVPSDTYSRQLANVSKVNDAETRDHRPLLPPMAKAAY